MKNVWIKYTIRHGPGHHGKAVHYIYFSHEVTQKDLEYECDILCRCMDNAIARWRIVKKLPKSVKEKFIERYERKIARAHAMIQTVRMTPALKKDISKRELEHVR
jgi:hypothetical protein